MYRQVLLTTEAIRNPMNTLQESNISWVKNAILGNVQDGIGKDGGRK